jgi:hypothetical protein
MIVRSFMIFGLPMNFFSPFISVARENILEYVSLRLDKERERERVCVCVFRERERESLCMYV